MTAATAEADDLVRELRSLASPENRAGMARFGIETGRAFGIAIPTLRKIAGRYKRRHDLALALWETGWHEARLLAAFVDDPAQVTPAQMDAWAADFDSWDLCDQACANLFAETPHAKERIAAWAKDEREFVRRAAFATIAGYAVRAKKAPDADLRAFLPIIEAASTDDRNFVRKAVNWALRQIGKRSESLHGPALKLARKLAASDDKAARWIGKDAVRELTDPAQIARIAARGKPAARSK